VLFDVADLEWSDNGTLRRCRWQDVLFIVGGLILLW